MNGVYNSVEALCSVVLLCSASKFAAACAVPGLPVTDERRKKVGSYCRVGKATNELWVVGVHRSDRGRPLGDAQRERPLLRQITVAAALGCVLLRSVVRSILFCLVLLFCSSSGRSMAMIWTKLTGTY
jgi:hypothetical protein